MTCHILHKERAFLQCELVHAFLGSALMKLIWYNKNNCIKSFWQALHEFSYVASDFLAVKMTSHNLCKDGAALDCEVAYAI